MSIISQDASLKFKHSYGSILYVSLYFQNKRVMCEIVQINAQYPREHTKHISYIYNMDNRLATDLLPNVPITLHTIYLRAKHVTAGGFDCNTF